MWCWLLSSLCFSRRNTWCQARDFIISSSLRGFVGIQNISHRFHRFSWFCDCRRIQWIRIMTGYNKIGQGKNPQIVIGMSFHTMRVLIHWQPVSARGRWVRHPCHWSFSLPLVVVHMVADSMCILMLLEKWWKYMKMNVMNVSNLFFLETFGISGCWNGARTYPPLEAGSSSPHQPVHGPLHCFL